MKFSVWLRHLIKGCTEFRIEREWVEVDQKKNKPPEDLYQIRKYCNDCEALLAEAYIRRGEFIQHMVELNGHFEDKKTEEVK